MAENIRLVNEGGRIVGKDPETGETVPIHIDALVADEVTTSTGPVYDVTHPDFGAIGDGSADDTEAIQSAIDAAKPGGVVYIPEGTFRLNTVTTQSSDQDYLLIIDEPDVTIRGPGTLGTDIRDNQTDLLHVNAENTHIAGLTFVGPGVDTSTNNIHFQPVASGSVWRVSARDWGSGLGAIDVSQGNYRTVYVANCHLRSVYRGIVQSNYQGRLVAIANRIADVTQQGIRVTGQGGYVAGNVVNCQNSDADGIYIRDLVEGQQRASFYTIAHNFIHDCDAGIELHSAGGPKATSNDFVGNVVQNATFGYDIRGATHQRIVGGEIRDIDFKAFQLGGGADEITIRDTFIEGTIHQHDDSVGTVRLFNTAGEAFGSDVRVYRDGVLGKGRGGVDLTSWTGLEDGEVALSDGSADEFPAYATANWNDDIGQWVRADGQATVTPNK